MLAADGTLRWTGAAVGKLVAGEEVLRPRVRIIADEHLSGAPREAVDGRLDRWLKSHIEKLLGPLFALSGAADITGIARGVAFQLVEALGVLERQRVAEEVKGLEQPERATLRKYGVRFGAYHIYLPLLLKPAPRALAAQLWALAHEGLQSKGLDDLLHLAGSGRTSIPVNKEIDAVLYRAAGYRVCGERAVRVDILERLADLIRPALAWREGAPGAKPPGAIVGGGFTVVNTMTSLTGASGEDFASILRSLGYRLDRRPKPPEPVEAAPTAAIESPDHALTADETAAGVEPSSDEIAPDADVAEVAAEPSSVSAEAESVPADAVQAHDDAQPDEDVTATPAVESAAIEASEEPAAAAKVEAAVEPATEDRGRGRGGRAGAGVAAEAASRHPNCRLRSAAGRGGCGRRARNDRRLAAGSSRGPLTAAAQAARSGQTFWPAQCQA